MNTWTPPPSLREILAVDPGRFEREGLVVDVSDRHWYTREGRAEMARKRREDARVVLDSNIASAELAGAGLRTNEQVADRLWWEAEALEDEEVARALEGVLSESERSTPANLDTVRVSAHALAGLLTSLAQQCMAVAESIETARGLDELETAAETVGVIQLALVGSRSMEAAVTPLTDLRKWIEQQRPAWRGPAGN